MGKRLVRENAGVSLFVVGRWWSQFSLMAWLRHRNRNSAWSISDRNRNIDFRPKWCFTISSFQQKFIKITFFVRNYFWSADTSLRRRNQLQQKKTRRCELGLKIVLSNIAKRNNSTIFRQLLNKQKTQLLSLPGFIEPIKKPAKGVTNIIQNENVVMTVGCFKCSEAEVSREH